MSQFKRDKEHEKIIASWLDKFFYSRLDIFEVGYKRVEKVWEVKESRMLNHRG